MALSPGSLFKGLVARLINQITPDAPEAEGYARFGAYRDLKVESVMPTDHFQADEGSMWVATTLPGATALQNGLIGAWTNALATIVIQNLNPPGGKSTWVKKLKLVQSVAPNAGTNLRYSVVLDTTIRTPTTLATPAGSPIGPGTPATGAMYPVPIFSPRSSIQFGQPGLGTKVYFPLSTAAGVLGAVPAQSPNAKTIVGDGMIKNSIPVVFDAYTIQFGSCDEGGSFQGAAALAKLVEHAPPLIIDPQHSAVITLYSTGNTATAGNAWDSVRLEGLEK